MRRPTNGLRWFPGRLGKFGNWEETVAEQGSVDLNLVASTVNGSGSQSANLVLTRAVFAMGIPVAPKNLFPSNIEGLPTWFYLRANSAGYRAGRRRADLLVALDRATFQADIARLEPGGVLVFEEAFGPPPRWRRGGHRCTCIRSRSGDWPRSRSRIPISASTSPT
jgi:hypothetical protein